MQYLSILGAITFILGFAPSVARALDPALLTICREHYSSGNRDIRNNYSNIEKTRVFLSAICSIEASTYSDFRDKAKHLNSSGDTPWGLFKIKANARENYQQFKSELKAACDKVSDYDFLKEVSQISENVINRHVGELFNGCVTTLAEYANEKGFSLIASFLFQGSDGRRFDVFLTYSTPLSKDELIITQLSPNDRVKCKFNDVAFIPGKPMKLESKFGKGEFILQCERPANEALSLTINTQGLSTSPLSIPVLHDPFQDLRDAVADLRRDNSKLKEEVDGIKAAGLSVVRSSAGKMNGKPEINNSWYAECEGNKKVIGGGCFSLSGNVPIQNMGPAGKGWSCVWAGAMPSGAEAFALCAH